MTCRTGLLAEDCAADHWCSRLGGHREGSGWRANCPYPGCFAERALQWDVPGKGIRWKSWCAEHDQDALRPFLADRLGPCFVWRRADRMPIGRDDLIDLALSGLPPLTMRLRMLELAGMSTGQALDKLGVRPDNRARVIAGRTGGTSKWTRNRRS